MNLEIIFGSPLSDRRERIYKTLLTNAKAHPEERFFMIVPEQESLNAQKDLVALSENHILTNVDVLSFSRLAYRVFSEVGETNYELVDESGKLLLVRYAMNRVKDNLGKLRNQVNKQGVAMGIKSIISELMQHNISVEDIGESLKHWQGDEMLRLKMEDIKIIYEEFLNLIENRYELPEGRMMRFLSALPKWQNGSNVEIAFDGFTGFTVQQYEILRALLPQTKNLIFGIIKGTGEEASRNPEKTDLFYMSDVMAQKIREIGEEKNLKVKESRATEYTEASYRIPAEFFHLEKNLYHRNRNVFHDRADNIRILSAPTVSDEIGALIAGIKKSIRSGYSFSDIGVICGDLENYREDLKHAFHDADIPGFIDLQSPIHENPYVLFLKSFLAIVKYNFRLEDVYSFLKNPLTVKAYEDYCNKETICDVLSPYDQISEAEMFAYGLGRKGFRSYKKEWKVAPKRKSQSRLLSVNRVREFFISRCEEAYRTIQKQNTIREKITAMKNLANAFFVSQNIKVILKDSPLYIRSSLQEEYEKVEEYILRFFDMTERLLGDMSMDAFEFSDVVLWTIENLTLSRKPPVKDRVVIGDLMRTRLSKIKKLFIIGANEGLLPPIRSGIGLFSDMDRENLIHHNIEIAETAQELTFFDHFYLYLTLLIPSESIQISYVAGKELRPSPLLREIIAILPKVKTETFSREEKIFLNSENMAKIEVAKRFRELKNIATAKGVSALEGDERWSDSISLVKALTEKPENQLGKILEGLNYSVKEESISEKSVETLYPKSEMVASVSQLETYILCPYRHFLNYGLQLYSERNREVRKDDYGSLLHEILDRFFRSMNEANVNFRTIREDDQKKFMENAFRDTIENYQNGMLNETAKNQYLQEQIKGIVERVLKTLKEQWNDGDYDRAETEVVFGPTGKNKEISIQLPSGRKLILTGKIDRVDTKSEGKNLYVRIIDYKSSEHSLKYTDLYEGIQLQLMLYLAAAVEIQKEKNEGAQVHPAGVYYFEMKNPLLKSEDVQKYADASREGNPELPEEERISDATEMALRSQMKLNGFTNTDDRMYLLSDRNLEENKTSFVVSMKLNRDLSVSGSGKVLTTLELEKIVEHAKKKAKEAFENLSEGKIPVAPYKESCEYCDYRGICHFDRRLGNPIKEKKSVKKEQFMELIEEKDHGISVE